MLPEMLCLASMNDTSFACSLFYVFCIFVFILLSTPFLLKCLLDVASKEKERLEEKQRAARKERAKDEVEWHTR